MDKFAPPAVPGGARTGVRAWPSIDPAESPFRGCRSTRARLKDARGGGCAILDATRDRGRGVTVWFIGAGPGDPELLTLKAQRLIASCPVCLYAGSLVPQEVVAIAPAGARVLDTATMTLKETHAEIAAAHGQGLDVARVHSGDPSLYGAIAEQIRRLRADAIPYAIVPGVPAYAAAAAALGQELTIPEVAQSVVLTRMAMKSTEMPEGERLENFARTGATLAIHLGIRALRDIVRRLSPLYGPGCPVVVAYRVGWPDQLLIRGRLDDIHARVRAEKITRTALILVGPALAQTSTFRDSALYDPAKPHVLRPRAVKK